MSATQERSARRPLKSRSTSWARRLGSWLAAHGVRPNTISLASVAFAALACAGLVAARGVGSQAAQAGLLLGAAACIQLRLLANLLDGLVAVEGGLAGPTGELYNDVPDRVADALVLVGAGYATGVDGGVALAWGAAALAVMTAYLRALGTSLGLAPDFGGPMAKPQRMAAITAACVLSAGQAALAGFAPEVLLVALALVAGGSVLTCALRLRRLARGLEAR